jgi:predicted secreted Zn-dependent protease
MRALLKALPLLPALLLPAAPAVALDVIRDNQTYLVLGDSAEEIRASLDHLGPWDPTGSRRYDAYTRWTLEWHFDSRGSFNACEIARVWTTLRVTMTLPRHGSPSSLPDDLRNAWTHYLQRLSFHEEGHVRIPSDAAREIETALDRLRRSDCQLLEQDAKRIANAILQRARATDRSYDIQTDYGNSQGARFPWTEGDQEQLTDSERAKLKDRTPR